MDVWHADVLIVTGTSESEAWCVSTLQGTLVSAWLDATSDSGPFLVKKVVMTGRGFEIFVDCEPIRQMVAGIRATRSPWSLQAPEKVGILVDQSTLVWRGHFLFRTTVEMLLVPSFGRPDIQRCVKRLTRCLTEPLIQDVIAVKSTV